MNKTKSLALLGITTSGALVAVPASAQSQSGATVPDVSGTVSGLVAGIGTNALAVGLVLAALAGAAIAFMMIKRARG